MAYERKTENPIEFILKTKFNCDNAALKEYKEKCIAEVEKQNTNRGAQKTIDGLLERDFPGIRDHYPIRNWKQKSRKKDGKYQDVIIKEKTYGNALNNYSKTITDSINKYGRKSNKKMNSKLEEELKIRSSSDEVSNDMSSTVAGIIALADKGVKSVKTPDGWEVQF